MSKEAVESVIGKAILDSEFRKALAADPAKALESFDLTDTEKASLKSIDDEAMNALANVLDTRVSKMRANR